MKDLTTAPLPCLPEDEADAILVGRVWDPHYEGPRVVTVRDGELLDLTDEFPTVADLMEDSAPGQAVATAYGPPRWSLEDVLGAPVGDPHLPHLLAPIDLQVVKACGVTFAESLIERVIEERCGGDPTRAAAVRRLVLDTLGGSITAVTPGSAEASRVKEVLTAQSMWSQYLEVGLGPHPEVFTKAPVLSSVGHGSAIGIPPFSEWNNPEPELVLIVDSTGRVKGATLGNDVNLRDVEGRSALLLGMAKDNNGSCAIGPFVRLFHAGFDLDDLRDEEITLRVEGPDGFLLESRNSLARISRSFEELVAATHGSHHQYPDGFALFTGTLFAPSQDRGEPGMGFTHQHGDTVTIGSPRLGTLTNVTRPTGELPPWEFGIRAMTAYLATLRSPAGAAEAAAGPSTAATGTVSP